MKRLLPILLLVFSVGVGADGKAKQEEIHGVKAGEFSYGKLTALKMQQRLLATAEQFKEVGPVARVIHHDIAYPANAEEYDAMEGAGIMWVTSHSQIQEELPLRNMRLRLDGIGNLTISPAFVISSIEEDEAISAVLGKYRSDAVYLMPFFKETVGATLVADYSMNRTDFVLGNLESSFPKELGPLTSIYDEFKYPSPGVFQKMLRREFAMKRKSKGITKNQ